MKTPWRSLLLLPLLAACGTAPIQPPAPPAEKPRTSAEILEQSAPGDWRAPDPENVLYLELPKGRVVLELAAAFAPNHVANIRTLAREKYFDGLAIIRVQDNYVTQWGDPEEDEKKAKPVGSAKATLPPEFTAALTPELPFTPLPDGDVYAPEVGHSAGFPAARDTKSGKVWLTHCYGALGVARGNTPDSGGGTSLYVIISHSPRHLDRNITLAGRVIQGMELLSSLPRGTGPLGFYEKPAQRIPIRRMRVAADVPEKDRVKLELLRTDTETWGAFVEARRNRREPWFIEPAGAIELCNVPLPVREKK